MVKKPTRGRPGQKANLLDLVITLEENAIDDIKYENPLGKGDHTVIHFNIHCPLNIENFQSEKPLYDNVNYEEVKQMLKSRDCSRAAKI